MHQPHDDLFHFVFYHARHARPWLGEVLPAQHRDRIAWGTLAAEPEKTHGESLEQKVTDTVHSAGLVDDAKRRARFVAEHKSWDDAKAKDQLAIYAANLASRQLTEDEPDPPIVVPVLLLHGKRRRETRSEEPDEEPTREPTFEGEFRPRLRILVDDLSNQSEQDIRNRHLTPLGTLTFLCFRFLREYSDQQTLDAMVRWADLLRAVDRDKGPPSGEQAVAAIACYVMSVGNIPAPDLRGLFQHILDRPENTIMSTLENLKRESLEIGERKGRVEGRVEGRADILLRLLNKRFGPVPEAIEQRVRAASLDDLDLWTDRILDAETLEQVFAR